MNAWILIVSWVVVQPSYPSGHHSLVKPSHATTMQEFGGLKACQHASIEAQKIAPGIRVVCVPKGGPK